MSLKNFDETLDWLYSFEKFGIKPGLERIRYLTDKLNNPQDKYKTIHVAGTNGKGSVCRFLESIIYENGYKVGVYTSPHIEELTERITINKKQISKDEIISTADIVKPVVDEMMKNNNIPTFFEVFSSIAFKIFYDKNIDFAIIETGLGGRLDATNIIKPLVSVITNVSLEHQNILGKNINDIAFEKAGIIKKNIPIITAAKDKSIDVIKKIAELKNSSITMINDESWKKIDGNNRFQRFNINGRLSEYTVETSMLGRFQGENIALSISTIESLQMNGIFISDENIKNGIEKTFIPGRMEIFGNRPIILLDGAHNVSGINVLYDTIKNDFEYDKLILVIGILSDKKIKQMLKKIIIIADYILLTKTKNPRACNPEKLKKIIMDLNFDKKIIIKNSVDDAINYAKNIARKNDMICVTGSLYTVGEARNTLKNKF